MAPRCCPQSPRQITPAGSALWEPDGTEPGAAALRINRRRGRAGMWRALRAGRSAADRAVPAARAAGRGRHGAGVPWSFAGRPPVAVKVIRAELATDPEFRARFRREVAVARKVSGLFTAPVIDADTDGPEPWLATAYVAGPSLADAVTEQGRCRPPRCWSWRPGWPRACRRSTLRAWCTGTSSPPTCCWPRTGRG